MMSRVPRNVWADLPCARIRAGALRAVAAAQTLDSPMTRCSQSAIRFQLVKIWSTNDTAQGCGRTTCQPSDQGNGLRLLRLPNPIAQRLRAR